MKVFILTSTEHQPFVVGVVNQYSGHAIGVTTNIEHEQPGNYDVGISFMYTKKVPKEHLTVPWFNFHPAPLPEYKGRDLCYHAVMNGAKEFGATLHYMDEGFDTGDIIDVFRFPVLEQMVAEDISNKAIEKSKALFRYYLPKILETRVFPRIPNIGGTYYKKGKVIDEVPVDPKSPFGQFVRAVSFPSKGFHPRIDIGGVKYKIVREE